MALTPCRIAKVPQDRMREVTERHPHLTRLLWLDTLVDAAIIREWMVGLGLRAAAARLAHLSASSFCAARPSIWSKASPTTFP